MPKAAPRPCTSPGCRALVDGGGSRCSDHPHETSFGSARRGTRQQRGYGAEWDRTRVRILRRDSYLCQVCLPKRLVTSATEVDHRVSKAEGQRLGWTAEQIEADANLQAICRPCHREKSLAEAVRGRTALVRPADGGGGRTGPTRPADGGGGSKVRAD